MGNWITLLTSILLLALPAHAEDCSSLETVGWLAGDWTTGGEGRQVLESWDAVSADTFEGLGAVRASRDDEVHVTETLRLAAMSGSVYYIAKVPENDSPVPFRLTSCSGGSATFENPAHDFPKRISYRYSEHDGPGPPERMTVSVSGDGDQGFTLEFERVTEPGRN